MSKTITEVGLIVGGLALAALAGPIGGGVFFSLAVAQTMAGVGITTTLAGIGLALRNPPKSLGTSTSIPSIHAKSSRKAQDRRGPWATRWLRKCCGLSCQIGKRKCYDY